MSDTWILDFHIGHCKVLGYTAIPLSRTWSWGPKHQKTGPTGPLSFFCSEKKFNEVLTRVHSFGFDPKKMYLIYAMLVFFKINKSTVEHKFGLYQQFGWSREDCVAAFMRFPNCVKMSNKKIMETMDHLVNNVDLQPGAIALQPFVLGLCLEKRIKPRNMVISELLSKGLLKK